MLEILLPYPYFEKKHGSAVLVWDQPALPGTWSVAYTSEDSNALHDPRPLAENSFEIETAYEALLEYFELGYKRYRHPRNKVLRMSPDELLVAAREPQLFRFKVRDVDFETTVKDGNVVLQGFNLATPPRMLDLPLPGFTGTSSQVWDEETKVFYTSFKIVKEQEYSMVIIIEIHSEGRYWYYTKLDDDWSGWLHENRVVLL